MKAIILCAGHGERLAPLTDTIPKVMLPLDGKPLLGHTLDWLVQHGTDEVAINLHHLPDVITSYVGDGSQWGLRVHYSLEDKLLGTAGAVLHLRDWIDGDMFVVAYGDKYWQVDLSSLVASHMNSAARMTIAVHHTDLPLGAGLVDPSDYDRGRGVVLYYEEKPVEAFSPWANAGLYVCEPSVLRFLPKPPCDWGRDVLPELTRQAVLRSEPIQGLAMDIGTPERYAQAQNLAAQPGAIFLDRDGTINEAAPQGEYITRPEDFHFLPGALGALAFLAQNSERRIVVFTNQPCVGKGVVTREQVDSLHEWMKEKIVSAGGRIDGLYICPHKHGQGCACRKPAPGMLLDASRDLGINLAKSSLVGDSEFDLRAGRAAGVADCYQVMTGKPLDQIPGHEEHYTIYATLEDATRAIVEVERG